MLVNHILLALLWIIYCVLHSVLAGQAFKKQMQLGMGRLYRHYRLLYSIFAFVTLVGIFYFQAETESFHLYTSSIFSYLTGCFFVLAGALLMMICIAKYFINLSGIRSLKEKNASNELVITGVHRYVRHPLYLGTFVFIWGLFFLFPLLSLMIANVIITLYTLFAIRLEEDKLIMEFGESYRVYRHSVPMILPFLKTNRAV